MSDVWQPPPEEAPVTGGSSPILLGIGVGVASAVTTFGCSFFGCIPFGWVLTGFLAMVAVIALPPRTGLGSTVAQITGITTVVATLPWLLFVVFAFTVPDPLTLMAITAVFALLNAGFTAGAAAAGASIGVVAQRQNRGGQALMIGGGGLVFAVAAALVLVVMTIAGLTLLGQSISSKFETIANQPEP